jgi:hypothetical protein
VLHGHETIVPKGLQIVFWLDIQTLPLNYNLNVLVNVAFNKPTRSSSIWISDPAWKGAGPEGPPCLGNNGRIEMEMGDMNCVHTDMWDTSDPWWEVDLGKFYTVTNVTFYGRPGMSEITFFLQVILV